MTTTRGISTRQTVTFEIEYTKNRGKTWIIVDRGFDQRDAVEIFIYIKAKHSRMKEKRTTRLVKRTMTIEEEVLSSSEFDLPATLPES